MSIGPADFAPYRDQFINCACDTCNELAHALSDVLDFAGRRHAEAAARLLHELRTGRHVHRSYAELAAIRRAENAHRVAAAIAAGASEEQVAALRRGYTTVTMRDFYATGMGLGMTPGRYDDAVRRRADR